MIREHTMDLIISRRGLVLIHLIHRHEVVQFREHSTLKDNKVA